MRLIFLLARSRLQYPFLMQEVGELELPPPVGIMSTCYMVKCNHIIVEVQYYTTHESPLISILFPVRQTFCKFKKKILSNNLESKFFGHSFSHHFQLFFLHHGFLFVLLFHLLVLPLNTDQ